ncbi:hypothetical protein ZOD2009_22152 [Haladaptatus paucihalophilus DX253]|uniref:Uncharacterized protein n=1 Tax=Haladaptatus paucihalophilus DX253 TaxID=797209 RepID=E7R036_HALPU|nr:hypothetical protein ZOD2009_22152 [Haladaptatus paucihalophilus DX253]
MFCDIDRSKSRDGVAMDTVQSRIILDGDGNFKEYQFPTRNRARVA